MNNTLKVADAFIHAKLNLHDDEIEQIKKKTEKTKDGLVINKSKEDHSPANELSLRKDLRE